MLLGNTLYKIMVVLHFSKHVDKIKNTVNHATVFKQVAIWHHAD